MGWIGTTPLPIKNVMNGTFRSRADADEVHEAAGSEDEYVHVKMRSTHDKRRFPNGFAIGREGRPVRANRREALADSRKCLARRAR